MNLRAGITLLGFGNIERMAIKAAFAQAGLGRHAYTFISDLEACDLILADAEDKAALRLLLAIERVADTVFMGSPKAIAVAGAAAWLTRPIDCDQLLHAFDALLVQRGISQLPVLPATPSTLQIPPPQPPHPPQPALPLLSPTPPVAPTQRLESAHVVANRSPLALVVDESEAARHSMTQRLQRWGFNVEQAAHSGQALALLAGRYFDGVFIEANLGPASALNGFALCQRLKRRPSSGQRQPPWVALVTALNSPSDRVRGTLAGCDAYLTKPVDEDELARVLWVQGWAPPPRSARSYGTPSATN